MTLTTGIVVFDGAEELDFVGPWEVFTMARTEGDEVVTISTGERQVRSAKGLTVVADHTLDEHPDLDIVLVPGGEGTRGLSTDERMLEWLQKVSPGCKWTTSVCTGSFVLAAAGLLEGRRATTHWAYVDTLGEYGAVGEAVSDARFVRDGNVVTAAGVSAGIDMALWVVGQEYGVAHARATQRFMEYDPAPPYAADA